MKKLISGTLLYLLLISPVQANEYLQKLQNLPSSTRSSTINRSNRSNQVKFGDIIKVHYSHISQMRSRQIDFKYDMLKKVCDGDYHNHIIRQSCNSAWQEFNDLENSFYSGMTFNEFVTYAERFISLESNFEAKCKTNRWCTNL